MYVEPAAGAGGGEVRGAGVEGVGGLVAALARGARVVGAAARASSRCSADWSWISSHAKSSAHSSPRTSSGGSSANSPPSTSSFISATRGGERPSSRRPHGIGVVRSGAGGVPWGPEALRRLTCHVAKAHRRGGGWRWAVARRARAAQQPYLVLLSQHRRNAKGIPDKRHSDHAASVSRAASVPRPEPGARGAGRASGEGPADGD